METKQLSSIPETMLITLWAKATETEERNGLLHDEIARQIISNIEVQTRQTLANRLLHSCQSDRRRGEKLPQQAPRRHSYTAWCRS